MKTDTVYKLAFNQTLDLIGKLGTGRKLPSENELSRHLNVSRTTVRKVLHRLTERGIVGRYGRALLRVDSMPGDARYPAEETLRTSEQVEKRFFEWMLRGGISPGAGISELELARQFRVGTAGIREFLNRFSRFGLIEKRDKAGWLFKGFTTDFALELFEIRELFELRSARAFAQSDPKLPLWSQLRQIEREHHELLATFEGRFHDFSDLDNRFHRLVNTAARNRFIDDFYDIIAFIFHYHYQWNKRDEQVRNRFAIEEHLAYIAALFSRDPERVEVACRMHLASARNTLLAALAAPSVDA